MPKHHEIVTVADVAGMALSVPSAFFPLDLREVQVRGFHRRIQFMEVDGGEQGAHYSPNAKENFCQVESHVLLLGFHSRYPRGPLQPVIVLLAFSLQT